MCSPADQDGLLRAMPRRIARSARAMPHSMRCSKVIAAEFAAAARWRSASSAAGWVLCSGVCSRVPGRDELVNLNRVSGDEVRVGKTLRRPSLVVDVKKK